MAVTWSPADKAPALVLSNGNMTAERTGTGSATARATSPLPAGTWYFEFRIDALAGAETIGVGIANTTFGLSQDARYTGNSLVMMDSGKAYRNFFNGVTIPALAVGDVLCVAVSCDASTGNYCYFRKNNGLWNNAAGNPNSGPAAFHGSSIAVPSFPIVFTNNASRGTVNFGASPFAYSVPPGFSSLDTPAPSQKPKVQVVWLCCPL